MNWKWKKNNAREWRSAEIRVKTWIYAWQHLKFHCLRLPDNTRGTAARLCAPGRGMLGGGLLPAALPPASRAGTQGTGSSGSTRPQRWHRHLRRAPSPRATPSGTAGPGCCCHRTPHRQGFAFLTSLSLTTDLPSLEKANQQHKTPIFLSSQGSPDVSGSCRGFPNTATAREGFHDERMTARLWHLETAFWCYLDSIQTSCSFKAAKNLAFSVMFFSLFLSYADNCEYPSCKKKSQSLPIVQLHGAQEVSQAPGKWVSKLIV